MDGDKLGVIDKGLKHGAYRIVSGENWLVLIGDDTNFVPIEPWPRSNNDVASGKMQQVWNGITTITGEHWDLHVRDDFAQFTRHVPAALPKIDQTVRQGFPLRTINFRFGVVWARSRSNAQFDEITPPFWRETYKHNSMVYSL
jgi:hypothetical protein